MSGRPNMQQIVELRNALATVRKEADYVHDNSRQLAHLKLCVDQGTQRLATAEKEVKRLLDAMDCDRPGNFGYENRMVALLSGLVGVAEEHGRKNP